MSGYAGHRMTTYLTVKLNGDDTQLQTKFNEPAYIEQINTSLFNALERILYLLFAYQPSGLLDNKICCGQYLLAEYVVGRT